MLNLKKPQNKKTSFSKENKMITGKFVFIQQGEREHIGEIIEVIRDFILVRLEVCEHIPVAPSKLFSLFDLVSNEDEDSNFIVFFDSMEDLKEYYNWLADERDERGRRE